MKLFHIDENFSIRQIANCQVHHRWSHVGRKVPILVLYHDSRTSSLVLKKITQVIVKDEIMQRNNRANATAARNQIWSYYVYATCNNPLTLQGKSPLVAVHSSASSFIYIGFTLCLANNTSQIMWRWVTLIYSYLGRRRLQCYLLIRNKFSRV